jgi:hypothetical protein
MACFGHVGLDLVDKMLWAADKGAHGSLNAVRDVGDRVAG